MDPTNGAQTGNAPNPGDNYKRPIINAGGEKETSESPQVSQDNLSDNDGRAQYVGGFTIIPPNESRRSALQRIRQKGEEDLQRWKEENKPGPVNLPPSKLGGDVSLAEARQKQQIDQRQSKLQKKLKQEDMDQRRREAEEEEINKMKAVQREKTLKLEEKKRWEERQKEKQYERDRLLKTEQLLQRMERSAPRDGFPAGTTAPTSSWARGHEYREGQKAEQEANLQQMKDDQRRKSELLKEKQKQQEEQRERELDARRRRVNEAFLNGLQGGREASVKTTPSPPSDQTRWDDESSGLPRPSPVEEQSDKDYTQVVMNLQKLFPYCEREFLEEIVVQCQGDYFQACNLLQ